MGRPANLLCECGNPLNGRPRQKGCEECHRIDSMRFPKENPEKPVYRGGPNILNLANGQQWKFAHRHVLGGSWIVDMEYTDDLWQDR